MAVALATVATAVVLAGEPGSDEADCWGAWGAVESPWSGGDVAVSESPPTPEHPEGRCEVAVTMTENEGDEPWRHVLEVSYGTLPDGREELGTWAREHLRGDAAPLPDGLPGGVSAEHGLLVLPERCDTEGAPTVVTMTTRYSEERTDRGDEAAHGSRPANGPSHMAGLLVEVARRGMAGAGCAAGEDDPDAGPLDASTDIAPVGGRPTEREGARHLCGHPDLPEEGRPTESLNSARGYFHAWTSAVGAGDDTAVCTVARRLHGFDARAGDRLAFGPPTSATVLLSTAQPDTARLLEDLADRLGARPVDDWEGPEGLNGATVVHGGSLALAALDCARGDEAEPARTLFAAYERDDAPRLLADYTRATAPHRGCGEVTPDA
ncbi:hypothetical protein [Streptomyces sedi]|uniref:Uncharacterized protein n=1 Tax=Streptomyces sedi TaxID=555059 RepID=A0A5C4V197_9ACTN|nr:hypothetical protein [Streptomyces sedi]TNM29761.1 hypothetical protein FH715_13515 [Streptomyces sedi]